VERQRGACLTEVFDPAGFEAVSGGECGIDEGNLPVGAGQGHLEFLAGGGQDAEQDLA
jgi:hypothetical protein